LGSAIADEQNREAAMPQPKKTSRARQTRGTGAGARTTKSTARGAKSTGARRQTRRSSAQAKGGEPSVEAAAERIRELNERIIETGKRAGRGTLDIYESTLKAIAESLERGPGSSDVEWVSRLATTQANFIRDLTKAWGKAARDVLK
jgi:hypothetical protein